MEISGNVDNYMLVTFQVTIPILSDPGGVSQLDPSGCTNLAVPGEPETV